MQYIDNSILQTILSSDQPKIVLYIMSDHRHHSLQNELSCIYVKTSDGEFYSSFSHPDYPKQSTQGLVINNAYTTNIKDLMNLGIKVNDSVDVLYFEDVVSSGLLNKFYEIKLDKVRNINNIVPIFKHIENLRNVANSLKFIPVDTRYKTMYHNLMPYVFSQIERRGVPVNNELFLDYYGQDKIDLIRDNRVYTSYNLYTTTGRPSNTHSGVNYAALNKADGSRRIFGGDKVMVNIDFNSYHLFLICEKLGIELPTNAHEWLGKMYFNKDVLSEVEYDEAKKITFRNLYGYQMDENVKNLELFKKIAELQENLWTQYQSAGYLLTDYNNRIVVENASKNKVFNYYIQSLETETNVKQLYNIIDKNLTPILYTYDSMVFEIEYNEAEYTRNTLKEQLIFPYTTKIGHNLEF